MNKKIILTTILLVSFCIFFVWKKMQNDKLVSEQKVQDNIEIEKEGLTKIQVGDKELWVEVAETAEEKKQGLSNRASLAENTGLLFSYDQPQTAVFWMKDMFFAIDIIWIADNKIIGIEKNVLPPEPGALDKNLVSYPSPGPVDYVLEVNGGWCKRNRIEEGFSFFVRY